MTVAYLLVVGDFIPTGAPLLRVWRLQRNGDEHADGIDEVLPPLKSLARAIQTGTERTMTEESPTQAPESGEDQTGGVPTTV